MSKVRALLWHASQPKKIKNRKIKQKQYCSKFNKDFLKIPHQNKNLKKIYKLRALEHSHHHLLILGLGRVKNQCLKVGAKDGAFMQNWFTLCPWPPVAFLFQETILQKDFVGSRQNWWISGYKSTPNTQIVCPTDTVKMVMYTHPWWAGQCLNPVFPKLCPTECKRKSEKSESVSHSVMSDSLWP